MTRELGQLVIDEAKIADFCRRHGIRRLAIFGSALRDDFEPESDVDVLIEFEPGTRMGFEFFSLPTELEDIIGRRVDLCTPSSIRRAYRDMILSDAKDVYVAA